MKKLKKAFIIFPFFILSCASAQYIESYEPINVFLETQKLEKGKKYILQTDKVNYTSALRLFNRGEGANHIIDSNDLTDYTGGLFEEKYWKKMYKQYAQDTVKKYWRKEDFPAYDFVLESRDGLLGGPFMEKYLNTRIDTVIMISEPMYYMDKKYIMFYVSIYPFFASPQPEVVIMKKENEKWLVVKRIGDYNYY